MKQKPLYVNDLPRLPGKSLQNVHEQPSKGTSKLARRLIGVSLLLSFLMAASLVVMIVFYFQRETYLKEANREAKRIASSLASEELQGSANLQDELQPRKSDPNMLSQSQGQFRDDTNSPSSNRDRAGFQILRSLERIEAAAQSLQETAKACNRDSKCNNASLDGWMRNGVYLYYFSTAIKNWIDAEKFCLSHNSHLASIRTEQELMYLNSKKGKDHFWIGALVPARTCFFVDGSVCGNPSFWAEFQPDNRVYKNMKDGLEIVEIEQCVELRGSGLWNDIVCSAQLKWICKKSCALNTK